MIELIQINLTEIIKLLKKIHSAHKIRIIFNKKASDEAILGMGRVVGLSWIFCVKRVFVFCLRDLHHLAKALRTLQKIRSNFLIKLYNQFYLHHK